MNEAWYLGIDTSNYTTSILALSEAGEILAESRKILPVESGKVGLRQSEAHFHHLQQFPTLFQHLTYQLSSSVSLSACRGIGVSIRPRPLAVSYMPVFQAGWSIACTLAAAWGNLPVVRTSHQENHLAAAEYFISRKSNDSPYIAVHLSGGTSDVLLVKKNRFGYRIETLGEGADLHAGQYVDRVGTAMGLPFPAGPHIEALAKSSAWSNENSLFSIPSSVRGSSMSFSGPCAAALRALDNGVETGIVARAVELSIANAVIKAVSHGIQLHPEVEEVVIAGGVAANQTIRQRIEYRLNKQFKNFHVYYAPVSYSSDNALGTAMIARNFIQKR